MKKVQRNRRTDFPSESQKRYADAAAALESAIKPKAFHFAYNAAIAHCEKAHHYEWPEENEIAQKYSTKKSWDGASAAALKLAAHLECDHWLATMRIGTASLASKISIKNKSQKTDPKALAAFLRAFAKQRLKSGLAETYNFGPLRIKFRKRFRIPQKVILLTISLTHMFRKISDSKGPGVEFFVPQPVENKLGQPCWRAAAEFACATFGGEPYKVEVAAVKWFERHEDRLIYVGWAAASDNKTEQ